MERAGFCVIAIPGKTQKVLGLAGLNDKMNLSGRNPRLRRAINLKIAQDLEHESRYPFVA